ncbi:MAG: hypothetical protein EBU90_05980 [Proteobacteria bacterium]|nr:hypothetical protein [Pseudomonadota bacterium]NBP13992.1 hypothetical protein [bacterium]
MSLANPLSEAFQGLTNNVVGIGRGTNPLSQPQITSLLGFNIPGVPLISTRDYFLLQLQSWLTSIPLQTQWIAVIDSFPYALRSDIIQGLERTDGAKKGFDISQAKTLLTSYPFQKVIGCVFAQGAQIPGEQYEASDVGIENNRGFIPGIISGNRKGYSANQLQLGFLETNTSIVDFVFRPWVMLASHYGYVARPGDRPGSKDYFNVKSNITILCYTRSYQNVSQIPRKVFTFYNAVPTNIQNFNLDYGNEPTQAVESVVNFTYTNYTVQNSMYFPLADIIQTVGNAVNGKYTPVVSPLQQSSNAPQNVAGFF